MQKTSIAVMCSVIWTALTVPALYVGATFAERMDNFAPVFVLPALCLLMAGWWLNIAEQLVKE